ncbi:MAG TPA: poly(R)-hydroxyalkanoic acid synthase subunit PhaE [Deltaproteobacteria bacterium]|nr:poly(R)-hydroxyalkanoic acid synthase subunit PhaE [Deltaproteobacteria bacterium]HPP80131.1 poly(R)-hydroxyalkanoic acid synthase subunit PhaE [Deltaproteobacteria bacterium]
MDTTASPNTHTLDQWASLFNPFWSLLSAMTRKAGETEAPEEAGLTDSHVKTSQEALLAIFKTWSAFTETLSEPSSLTAVTGSITAFLPELVNKVVAFGLSGFMKVQSHFMEKFSEIGKGTQAFSFDNLDKDSLRFLADLYEKEVRPYLKVPQLGLMRFHQERMNEAFDAWALFQTKLAAFLRLVGLPVEKSVKVFQETVERQIREGGVPDDPRKLYTTWIKILEGHFMTLFKSPEYTAMLADTLASLESFLAARNRVLEDLLQSLPIPSSREVDELAKELHDLKRRVRDLEKAAQGPRRA